MGEGGASCGQAHPKVFEKYNLRLLPILIGEPAKKIAREEIWIHFLFQDKNAFVQLRVCRTAANANAIAATNHAHDASTESEMTSDESCDASTESEMTTARMQTSYERA